VKKNGHRNQYAPITPWQWNEKRSAAAIALAEGKTEQETADLLELERKTLWNWKQVPEFAAEVDRLSLMVGISSRAERLRIAMRVAQQKVKDDKIDTEKDILDWLKFAQSETDGIKLDLTKLAAFGEADAFMADSGSAGDSPEESVN
jgi:hypothetical protein